MFPYDSIAKHFIMNSENGQPLEQKNEDLQFDKNNISTTETQGMTDNEILPDDDPIDQSKQEELATNDVPPLSEVEKQPKIQEEDRIKEMNERTSIGD